MRRILASVFIGLGAVLLYSHLLFASTASDILRKADQSRGNLEGVTWNVILLTTGSRRDESMTLDVQARGFDLLAENLAPPKDRGNKTLMLNGNMWFHRPGLSKAVPISQRQKLLGNAAYGDIAATNYAEDYEGALLDEETVNGELCYVVDLKAKGNKTTYDRIKYWISKERLVGVKAQYFTVSGKKVKSATMEYGHTVKVDGEVRPFISKMIISDELLSSNVTTLYLDKPTFRKLASYVFDLNLLAK